jgi:hypothetical protein
MVRLLRRRGARRKDLSTTDSADFNGMRVLRVARPTTDRRLRDGWVIEASVLARLLRIRLLRLEARVALVPAALAENVDYEPALRWLEPGASTKPAYDGSLSDASEMLSDASRKLEETARR